MKHNLVTPSVGESITEVSILKWNKQDGQAVKVGEVLLEIESDKATVELVAENAGVLKIMKPAGERLPIGAVIGEIDDAGTATLAASSSAPTAGRTSPPQAPPAGATALGATGASLGATGASGAPRAANTPPPFAPSPGVSLGASPSPGPAARKMLADVGVDAASIAGTGKDGRVTKGDILNRPSSPAAQSPRAPTQIDQAGDRRVPMTMLRSRIAERLVMAQHTAAILTTFNEVDMTAINEVRAKNKEAFKAKYGVNLSFMSFFTRAAVETLKLLPEVNASIDGRDIVYHDYVDMGIAVGTERGLVVPVIRGAQTMGFVDIEKKIGEFAVKARDSKLSIADLTGGTFTISNGGTYGSLMSTPILNPPQSGILGMHKIQDRPMAINGKVEIRPMMYLALSYDHRIVDGKGAVTFLVTLRDFLENPTKLGLNW